MISSKGLEDDRLDTPIVGAWGEKKYRLIGVYADTFATAMKGKWGARVYIDLFAGAGRVRLRGSQRLVASSATRAMGVKDPFDRYIFCDMDNSRLEALVQRATRDYPGTTFDPFSVTVMRGLMLFSTGFPSRAKAFPF